MTELEELIRKPNRRRRPHAKAQQVQQGRALKRKAVRRIKRAVVRSISPSRAKASGPRSD